MINPAQCRAARGLVAWSQQDLASEAGIGVVTVHQFEAGTSVPRRATTDVIKRAFEIAGVEFTNGDQPGVRLTKASAAQSAEPARPSKRTVSAKTVRGKTAKASEKKPTASSAGAF